MPSAVTTTPTPLEGAVLDLSDKVVLSGQPDQSLMKKVNDSPSMYLLYYYDEEAAEYVQYVFAETDSFAVANYETWDSFLAALKEAYPARTGYLEQYDFEVASE